LTALSLPGSTWSTTGLVDPVTDPGAFPVAGLQVTAHAAGGALAGVAGAGFGGVLPLNGAAKVCLYAACGLSGNISNISVPLSVVGAGGYAQVIGAVNLTIVGAPWTTGTAAAGTLTAMGGVEPPSNTAAGSGMLALVTPFFIASPIAAYSLMPGIATLSLHFVPEPGTLLLVGSAVAALGAGGARRRRAER
jgi:hypothetical protein